MNYISSKTISGLALIILTQILFIQSVSAARINFEDHGTYFTDNSSGLDWLDVTTSINQSYNFVTINMAPGGAYAGWRYASGTEFQQLVTNYTGGVTQYGKYYRVNEDTIDGLVEMLGSTLDSHNLHYFGKSYDTRHGYAEGEGWDYTYGFIADVTPQGERWLAMLYDDDLYSWRPDVESAHWQHHRDSQDSYSFGSYLVRDTKQLITTPLPPAIWFFGSGLLGVMGLTRKNKGKIPA